MNLRKIFNPYIVVSIFLILSTYLFVSSKPNFLLQLKSDPLLVISQALAIIGMVSFALTFVFMIRNKFIENWCGGLDKAYDFHHNLGISSFTLLINHPILLILRSGNLKLNPLSYVLPGVVYTYSLGIISLYFLILFISFTIFIKLPYHVWKFTHRLMVVAFVFGFLHLINITSDVSRSFTLFYWMVFISAIGLISYIYRELAFPFLAPKYQYKLTNINDLGDAVEIFLTPKSTPLIHMPGQFVYIRFNSPKQISFEEHPFSISSPSNSTILRLSINKSGDYTKRLSKIKLGCDVDVTGPYGKFYEHIKNDNKVALIAGGIGITPFLGMIHSDKSKAFFVFYIVRDQTHAFYDKELVNTKNTQENITYFLYNSQDGKKITGDEIKNKLNDLSKTVFLLCGPKGFMESIKRQLKKLGVSSKSIFMEDFNLK